MVLHYSNRMTLREHHPIVRTFKLSTVVQSPEFFVDFLDIRTRQEFVIGMLRSDSVATAPQKIIPGHPAFDEEYFEWVDVLESVAEAESSIVMVELGAGYGRWLMRAAAAARRRGVTFHAVGVEARARSFSMDGPSLS